MNDNRLGYTVEGNEAPVTDHADPQENLAALGVRIPDILLPRDGVDLAKWAVVACDQFTSERDYWEQVSGIVGDSPSTLNLIFPEVYLEDPDPDGRIAGINAAMDNYLGDGLFRELSDTMLLVRRETGAGAVRWGLIVALDLEQYSWEPDSTTLIRATEGTILSRLPPRVRIREDAALEFPHILVLISDEQRTLIEPLAARTADLDPVYDTTLMLGGGRVSAWAVNGPDDVAGVATALGALHEQLDPANPLLFAMGDGNHSFATAKSIWEYLKGSLPEAERADHPARFCLVEIENVFDAGLAFEPIHRVLFHTARPTFEAELAKHCASFRCEPAADLEQLLTAIEDQSSAQRFGYCDAQGLAVYALTDPATSLAAGTLQLVIDALVDRTSEVDYIHGVDVTVSLGERPGNIGLLLGPVSKETFFETIVADGAFPRKTFSMGEAEEKRYYLEARRIR